MVDSVEPLRERAEKLLRSRPDLPVPMHHEEIVDLVYELSVHQAELEMQNDELRRTQHELIDSRDRFTELFELAPVPYLTVNSANRIVEANNKSCEMFECNRHAINGSSIEIYFEPSSAETLFLCLRRSRLRESRVACELNLAHGFKARHVLVDLLRAKAVHSEDDLVRIIIIDVTEQKQAAAAHAEHLRAVQNERIETLGVMAGGVAHDFNNLLTPIMMHAELAGTDKAISEGTKKDLLAIVEAAKSAASLCHNLLEFAGKSQFDHQAISPTRLLHEHLSFHNSTLPPNINIHFEHDQDLPNIFCDQNQIRRVLSNLITNSIEAIGEDTGTISIAVETKDVTSEDLSKMTFTTDVKPGQFVCLSIRDTGCGMDEETLSRTFDPFFSTKFSGRGLGMASVIGIIREHGATMEIESIKGQGTNVIACFPTTVLAASPCEKSSTFFPKGAGTVLVVDDNSMVRESIQRLLEFAGFSPLSVSSGCEAIELMRIHETPIDVVLLDLVMPEMSGAETLTAIREIAPTLPVLIISGYADSEMLKEIKLQTVQGFISKPFSIGTLVDAISIATSGNQIGST